MYILCNELNFYVNNVKNKDKPVPVSDTTKKEYNEEFIKFGKNGKYNVTIYPK